MKFLSHDYTNPNTNPKTLTPLTLTLAELHDAFESFRVPVFCDFIRNYFLDSEFDFRTPRHFVISLLQIAIRKVTVKSKYYNKIRMK